LVVGFGNGFDLASSHRQVTELLSALEALLKNEDDIGNICLSVGRTTEAKIESMCSIGFISICSTLFMF
jgi:hypothetical protein